MQENLHQKLLNDCFRFVSYRPHSEKEIRDFLAKKLKRKRTFVNPEVIEKIIARLADFGYINDQKFSEWWIEQRTKNRPKGSRIIKQELLRKGIQKDVLNQELSGRNEKILARKAAKKIIGKIQKLPALEQKKKLFSYLLYRGFDTETALSAIDEIMGKRYNKEDDYED